VSAQAAQNVDYKEVRKAIEDLLGDPDYDDGSFAPLFIRLTWNMCGSYDKQSNTGGSNGATIRFRPENTYDANRGIHIARDRLETVKSRFPGLTYADLYTLAGVVAVEAMGGPKIKWTPGRVDAKPTDYIPPDGRLPDAASGADHVRTLMHAKGFTDQEIVALMGAHSVGRCHLERSGYHGPWTRAPTTFSNQFYKDLLDDTWIPERNAKGKVQFHDPRGELMRLPSDMCMRTDPHFRKWGEVYANDKERFFRDFAAAYRKLLHLGVPNQRRDGVFGWILDMCGCT